MPEEMKAEEGWGRGNYPYPRGVAFIECDEMKCVGCGICEKECPVRGPAAPLGTGALDKSRHDD